MTSKQASQAWKNRLVAIPMDDALFLSLRRELRDVKLSRYAYERLASFSGKSMSVSMLLITIVSTVFTHEFKRRTPESKMEKAIRDKGCSLIVAIVNDADLARSMTLYLAREYAD